MLNKTIAKRQPSYGHKPSWQTQHFPEQDSDPLTGFANIMDVMLVFALGLMLALIAQSQELQAHLAIKSQNTTTIELSRGSELLEAPEAIQQSLNQKTAGMESLGQVYKDPKTGKLILISRE